MWTITWLAMLWMFIYYKNVLLLRPLAMEHSRYSTELISLVCALQTLNDKTRLELLRDLSNTKESAAMLWDTTYQLSLVLVLIQSWITKTNWTRKRFIPTYDVFRKLYYSSKIKKLRQNEQLYLLSILIKSFDALELDIQDRDQISTLQVELKKYL